MKFRKIIYINLIFLAFTINAYSNFNTELSGIIAGGGDTGTMYGAGIDFSFSLDRLYALMYKGYITVRDDKKDSAGTDIDLEYRQMAQMIGIEFYIPVSFLNENRLLWKNSICAGYSWTEVSASDSSNKATVSDSGLTTLVSTGLQYVWEQHYSPFIDVAYYYSKNNGELSGSNISGYQVYAGIRYSFGSSKPISGEY